MQELVSGLKGCPKVNGQRITERSPMIGRRPPEDARESDAPDLIAQNGGSLVVLARTGARSIARTTGIELNYRETLRSAPHVFDTMPAQAPFPVAVTLGGAFRLHGRLARRGRRTARVAPGNTVIGHAGALIVTLRRSMAKTIRVAGLVLWVGLSSATPGCRRSRSTTMRVPVEIDAVVTPIGVPRPIAPLSTARIAGRRPEFRWLLPAGTDGARLDVCHNRDCSEPFAIFTAVGSRFTPDMDLPLGTVFWRLHGRASARTGDATSPTWQLRIVGSTARRPAMVRTYVQDINGDGRAEWIHVPSDFSMMDPGFSPRVAPNIQSMLFVGTAVGVTLAQTWTGPLRYRADVDGDGFGDMTLEDCSHRTMTFQRGSPAGLTGFPTSAIGSPIPSLCGTDALFFAGDANADGYADAGSDTDQAEGIGIYAGGASGFGAMRATAAKYVAPSDGNASPYWLGDVDHDGHDDVYVPANGDAGELGAVYFGDASAPYRRSVNLTTGHAEHAIIAAKSLVAADFNGDGFADIVVLDHADNHTYVFHGRRNFGASARPDAVLTTPEARDCSTVAITAISAGDVNGDGFDDVIVNDGLAFVGCHSHVFFGSAVGVATAEGQTLPGTVDAYAGDLNGDGIEDAVVLTGSGRDGQVTRATDHESAHVYLGGPRGLTLVAGFERNSLGPLGDVDGDGRDDVDGGRCEPNSAQRCLFLGAATGVTPNPFRANAPSTTGH